MKLEKRQPVVSTCSISLTLIKNTALSKDNTQMELIGAH